MKYQIYIVLKQIKSTMSKGYKGDAMGGIIFSYRVAYDMGFAPCIDHNIFTLACCKGGQIRNGKNIITGLRYHVGQHYYRNPADEIYLLGIYKSRMLYYARITDVITMDEYFSTQGKSVYGDRIDQIYDAEAGILKRNDLLPQIHPKGSVQIQQDRNGCYVLISRQFTYFGKNAPAIDAEILHMLPKNREMKKYAASCSEHEILHSYAMGVIGSFQGAIGAPHDSLYD